MRYWFCATINRPIDLKCCKNKSKYATYKFYQTYVSPLLLLHFPLRCNRHNYNLSPLQLQLSTNFDIIMMKLYYHIFLTKATDNIGPSIAFASIIFETFQKFSIGIPLGESPVGGLADASGCRGPLR